MAPPYRNNGKPIDEKWFSHLNPRAQQALRNDPKSAHKFAADSPQPGPSNIRSPNSQGSNTSTQPVGPGVHLVRAVATWR